MKILVIGDSCTDVFIYSEVTRLCPEAPAPVFDTTESLKLESSGMAGNVAQSLNSLGCEVDLISNSNNIIKTRYVDQNSNQLLLRVDEIIGDSNIFDRSVCANLSDHYDAIVVSDYNKGFLSYDEIEIICSSHPLTFLDTKKDIDSRLLGASFIKINKKEFQRNELSLSNYHGDLIITLGKNGASHKSINYRTKESKIFDLTGAGDAFLAALVYSYLKEKDIPKAIRFANKSASECVKEKGTCFIK